MTPLAIAPVPLSYVTYFYDPRESEETAEADKKYLGCLLKLFQVSLVYFVLREIKRWLKGSQDELWFDDGPLKQVQRVTSIAMVQGKLDGPHVGCQAVYTLKCEQRTQFLNLISSASRSNSW
ncbi:hypothetical protein AMTR_s00028p00095720 [Amborella trichopoda]|uniref:Uncharacterized protein n=1 Tax=Amborella trichopoda TaxID=13333 RepID=W1PTG7_AMBTC|nr:hypothetical protein AMTR_s00028p00095720 [Amborella trichopoda]